MTLRLRRCRTRISGSKRRKCKYRTNANANTRQGPSANQILLELQQRATATAGHAAGGLRAPRGGASPASRLPRRRNPRPASLPSLLRFPGRPGDPRFQAELRTRWSRRGPDRSSRAMGTYTFTSRPRVLPCQRARYREDLLESDEPMRFGNIMYDRRVVRGNTYALQTLPEPKQPELVRSHRKRRDSRKTLAQKRAVEQLKAETPEAVEGRKHVDVQTELYLEEIADRMIEVDMECQTDAFLDRPPTPLFIPAKTGKDVATQILEGELFDFDIEVRPMLEVLVGKTIEQALLEVMEEEELAALQASQSAFREMRNVELAEVQRLEEQERRHREEKERRKQQQWQIVSKQNETSQKIAARAFTQRYLADLLPSVFDSLREAGYFYDPVERDIELGFFPWLMHEVDKAMEHQLVGRTVVDMLIREVVERRLTAFEWKEGRFPYTTMDTQVSWPEAVNDIQMPFPAPEQAGVSLQPPYLGTDPSQTNIYQGNYWGPAPQDMNFMDETWQDPEKRGSF
ncbi:radial spoke head protein 3 homolog [Sorex fumeus]|uniref:radial spoke head protein 3 homolog n=1 Tax=Sorex fumeus TaxID=62283 RepID=UPI0024AC8D84|nr:radial spoke head protein 3 homolog [Sorex fumeus]